jgi:hypothetical protein
VRCFVLPEIDFSFMILKLSMWAAPRSDEAWVSGCEAPRIMKLETR